MLTPVQMTHHCGDDAQEGLVYLAVAMTQEVACSSRTLPTAAARTQQPAFRRRPSVVSREMWGRESSTAANAHHNVSTARHGILAVIDTSAGYNSASLPTSAAHSPLRSASHTIPSPEVQCNADAGTPQGSARCAPRAYMGPGAHRENVLENPRNWSPALAMTTGGRSAYRASQERDPA
ncbi:unnamed protein product [Cutaneotrichosporon oleaginosum]